MVTILGFGLVAIFAVCSIAALCELISILRAEEPRDDEQ